MKIVAFDLGSNMALAHNLDVDFPRTIHQEFKGHRVTRAAATVQWLKDRDWLFKHADLVIYERPFARGQDATRSLWGIAGLIEAVAGTHTVVKDVTPTEIKKWVTGAGGGGKPDMLYWATLYGYDGSNEHEADAYGLLKYAEATFKEPPCQKSKTRRASKTTPRPSKKATSLLSPNTEASAPRPARSGSTTGRSVAR